MIHSHNNTPDIRPTLLPVSQDIRKLSPSQNFIVVGNPIKHSKSPHIHQAFAQQVGINIHYSRQFCPDDVHSFHAVIKAFFNAGGVGANVTVPFKKLAYQLCYDNLTPYAQAAGAVNTLYWQGDFITGELCGHNTDGMGLVNHLKRLQWDIAGQKIAIIGAGGASRGIILPLLLEGVSGIHIANRTVSKAEEIIAECQHYKTSLPDDMSSLLTDTTLTSGSIENLTGHYDIIINATSIGLSHTSVGHNKAEKEPMSNRLPLSDNLTCTYAYDMMYGRELPFLLHFGNQGSTISDGYGMLIGQAALSFELWTGAQLNIDSLELEKLP